MSKQLDLKLKEINRSKREKAKIEKEREGILTQSAATELDIQELQDKINALIQKKRGLHTEQLRVEKRIRDKSLEINRLNREYKNLEKVESQ